MSTRKQLVEQYVVKFSGLGHNTIAKKIYKDHPLLFKTFNSAYLAVRRVWVNKAIK
jgi:hypothetical protein